MNKAAVEKTWQHLIAGHATPDRKGNGMGWDQGPYLMRNDTCGTMGCLAGHAAVAHGFVPAWPGSAEDLTEEDGVWVRSFFTDTCWSPDDRSMGDATKMKINFVAADLLELTQEAAERLFVDCQTDDIRVLREYLIAEARRDGVKLDLPIPAEWLAELELADQE